MNVKAHVWLLRAALSTFDKNTDGGHMIITGSIAVTNPLDIDLTKGSYCRRKFHSMPHLIAVDVFRHMLSPKQDKLI